MKNKILIITGDTAVGKTYLINKYLEKQNINSINVFDRLDSYRVIGNRKRNINISNFPIQQPLPENVFEHLLQNSLDKNIVIDEAYSFLSNKDISNFIQQSEKQFLLVFQSIDQIRIGVNYLQNIGYSEINVSKGGIINEQDKELIDSFFHQ